MTTFGISMHLITANEHTGIVKRVTARRQVAGMITIKYTVP